MDGLYLFLFLAAFCVYESRMPAEMDIRVDLLIVMPIFLIAALVSFVRFLRWNMKAQERLSKDRE